MTRRTFFCYACQCDKPEESKVRVSKAIVCCRSCVEAAAECKRTGVYNGYSPYSAHATQKMLYGAIEVEETVDECILDSYLESVKDD